MIDSGPEETPCSTGSPENKNLVFPALSPILASADQCAWVSLSLSMPMPLALSPRRSPPLCPWGPSPFILTPRAITISVVTAGHVTCTCSSGWSPHAGAIWSHTRARARSHTHVHFSWLPSPLFLLAPSWPHFSSNRSITPDFLLSPSPCPPQSLFPIFSSPVFSTIMLRITVLVCSI